MIFNVSKMLIKTLLKIYKFCIVICIDCCRINYVSGSMKDNQIDTIVNSLLNDRTTYQVALFDYRNINIGEKNEFTININSVVKNISKKCGILILNSVASEIRFKYINPKRPLLKSPIQTTLMISLFNVYSEFSRYRLKYRIMEIVEFIINLSPRRVRPYCLFIIDAQKKISTKLIEEILDYAWRKNFLDITILQSLAQGDTCENNLILNTFNPFMNTYSEHCYSSTITVFPKKIIDMNKYPVRIALMRRLYGLKFDMDSSGNLQNISGTDYGTLTIISEVLNFKIEWIPQTVKSFNEPVFNRNGQDYTVLDLIISGEYDLGGNQIYLFLALQNDLRQGEMSIAAWSDDFCILVPVFPTPTSVINYTVVRIVISIIVHVGVMHLLIKLFKLDSWFWLPHHILQILLGNPPPKLPNKASEKFFYLCLACLSSVYSVRLYAKLTNINLIQSDQGPYNTFNDLENSNLTLEIHQNYMNITFQESEDMYRGLKRKVKIVKDIMNCPDRLLKYRNIGCFIDKSIALAHIRDDSRLHRPRLKIMEPCFWSATKGIIFSESSVYVVKFNKILRIIVESGLWVRWIIHDKEEIKHSISVEDNIMQGTDKFLQKKLAIVWLMGIVTSGIIFVSEFITKYINKQSL